MANPNAGFQEVSHLLDQLELIDVDTDVIERARRLVDARLRALDGIHLASALLIRAEEVIAYDRRLLQAAARAGLPISSPGA
jgi:hypothetical protein